MSLRAARDSSIYGRLGLAAVKASDWLLDLVFPPACGNCGWVDARFCPACRAELAGVELAVSARYIKQIDGFCATGKHHGILAAAIRAFKYEGAIDLCDLLAERMFKALGKQGWRFDAVVPAPLYADRLLERGYNQSALLGERLAQMLGIRCEPGLLRRTRNTDQQARLSGSARLRNVEDAFEASPAVKGLSVLLVDDVVTTGATLGECAAALQKRHAAAVYGVSVSLA